MQLHNMIKSTRFEKSTQNISGNFYSRISLILWRGRGGGEILHTLFGQSHVPVNKVLNGIISIYLLSNQPEHRSSPMSSFF